MQAQAVERQALTIRIPVEDLGRYAGLTALVTSLLAAAGILATVAYLSAWGVPGPVVRMDPLTAALRSETVLYQVLLLSAVVFGLGALWRRLGRSRWIGRIAIVAGIGVVAVLAVDAFIGGWTGPAITIGGGAALLAGHESGRLSTRTTWKLFAVVALVAAMQTGAESGRLIRDDVAYQTELVLATRTPVAGLGGGVEDGGGYRYGDLYLVFRDGESLYVSRPGTGAMVWIVPSSNLMSFGIVGR
ncbi:MAG TPA: hypothetical protein VFX65_11380 [Candidatus Limnocylindrales bacterium]|nr:hypothetical protein [Candidatus Limnocylindrales bacterium]